VTDIYNKLNLEQSVASQHLAILRHAAIVKTKKSEKFVFYSLNYPRIEEIQEKANELVVK
jgi:DNA-binding transcriptional ArsR family regulator